MIVIDAGSSGSRAHLYTFGAPQLTTIREEWSLKRWPGLSACALREGNAPSIEANISGCARKNLSHMLHDLEAGCRSKSVHCAGAPVYLRATAGLRLLPPFRFQRIYMMDRGANYGRRTPTTKPFMALSLSSRSQR